MMTYQQFTLDLIEGRVSPDDYAHRLNGDPGLLDWLQGCIPADETMEQAVPSTFSELTAAELPEELHRQISAAIDVLRHAPSEPALSVLLPLLNEAGRIIPLRTTIVFHLASTYAAILDGTLPCADAQRRTLPGAMLEAIDRPFDRTVSVPYSVRVIWENLQKESRPGTLAYRLNLHGWITELMQQHRPDLAITPDTTLEELHALLLLACPACVDGPEVWACGILERLVSELPEGLKRPQRMRLLKERISQAFHLAPKAQRPAGCKARTGLSTRGDRCVFSGRRSGMGANCSCTISWTMRPVRSAPSRTRHDKARLPSRWEDSLFLCR